MSSKPAERTRLAGTSSVHAQSYRNRSALDPAPVLKRWNLGSCRWPPETAQWRPAGVSAKRPHTAVAFIDITRAWRCRTPNRARLTGGPPFTQRETDRALGRAPMKSRSRGCRRESGLFPAGFRPGVFCVRVCSGRQAKWQCRTEEHRWLATRMRAWRPLGQFVTGVWLPTAERQPRCTHWPADYRSRCKSAPPNRPPRPRSTVPPQSRGCPVHLLSAARTYPE